MAVDGFILALLSWFIPVVGLLLAFIAIKKCSDGEKRAIRGASSGALARAGRWIAVISFVLQLLLVLFLALLIGLSIAVGVSAT